MDAGGHYLAQRKAGVILAAQSLYKAGELPEG